LQASTGLYYKKKSSLITGRESRIRTPNRVVKARAPLNLPAVTNGGRHRYLQQQPNDTAVIFMIATLVVFVMFERGNKDAARELQINMANSC
jgi:hypothetical protein